jgi:hypothetical protein
MFKETRKKKINLTDCRDQIFHDVEEKSYCGLGRNMKTSGMFQLISKNGH